MPMVKKCSFSEIESADMLSAIFQIEIILNTCFATPV